MRQYQIGVTVHIVAASLTAAVEYVENMLERPEPDAQIGACTVVGVTGGIMPMAVVDVRSADDPRIDQDIVAGPRILS